MSKFGDELKKKREAEKEKKEKNDTAHKENTLKIDKFKTDFNELKSSIIQPVLSGLFEEARNEGYLYQIYKGQDIIEAYPHVRYSCKTSRGKTHIFSIYGNPNTSKVHIDSEYSIQSGVLAKEGSIKREYELSEINKDVIEDNLTEGTLKL